MPKNNISQPWKESLALRAFKCCEYCKSQDKYSPTAFTIDHVIPESLDGTTDFENLAYACFLCNRLKSNKFKVFDGVTEKWVRLFNPRKDIWKEHFVWNNTATNIIGISTVGRCTVNELRLNRDKLVEYRNCIIQFGKHPPEK